MSFKMSFEINYIIIIIIIIITAFSNNGTANTMVRSEWGVSTYVTVVL